MAMATRNGKILMIAVYRSFMWVVAMRDRWRGNKDVRGAHHCLRGGASVTQTQVGINKGTTRTTHEKAEVAPVWGHLCSENELTLAHHHPLGGKDVASR